MAFWGKLGGAAGGFFLGGPLGAVAGALAGHFLVDRATDPEAQAAEEADSKSLAFTIGVIALSAKMAKADGVVAPVEVEAFRKIFHIDDKDLEEVQGVFDRATYDVAGYESYARQLHDLFKDEPATLEDVLHGLAHIAAADGAMHEAEVNYLTSVADVFALDKASLRRAFGRYVQLPEDDPYEVLGVEPTASDAEVKRRHRALVAENHPDRATARGLPPEAVRIATSKLAVINAAWDAIRSERALA
ncbi:DnaJ family molecular chaperone [Chelatococcus sambhunathii]|uniref:DnaJ family molecular chaperone n=1 Tax=Chelatococcus sambhunathii TaxID=363953 RepID=A0ABU1DL73_9HYPH|nr:DnaJ family molecular chaperone [Chelatococcus sambhunathii]MDR4308888.1 DnaJ family molecular chaperone [Chelatococcus sambhunathii]